MNISEYRQEFATYRSSIELARYRQLTASEPEPTIDQVRVEFGDLFSADALAALKSLTDETRHQLEREAAGRQALLSAARLEYVGIQTREVTRELAACEASPKKQPGEAIVSPTQVSARLATEAQKARRDELARRWCDTLSTCDDLRATRLHELHEAAGKLGFHSYCDLIAAAIRTNLRQVQRDGQSLLEQTEPAHRLAMARVIKHAAMETPAGNMSFADLAYLERLPWLDRFFAAPHWPSIYAQTMEGLGIRVDKQPQLRIVFANPAPAGANRCFPVNPPHDVRLVLSPLPTAFGFAGSLHNAGLAQQHAWCSRELADRHPEFVNSPDPATNEGYGHLFSFLLLEPKWIEQFLAPISAAQARELIGDVTAVLTLGVRRLIAETEYAVLLHSPTRPSTDQLQSSFVDLHEQATAFHFQPELFLLDLHESLSSAGHLRAMAFAAGLREYLRRRYGNRWWISRKAGDELIDLWNTASRYPVEELARLIGFEMSFELLAELLTTTLSGAKQ